MGEAVTEIRIEERQNLRQRVHASMMRGVPGPDRADGLLSIQILAILNLADTVEALIKADDLDKRIRKLEEAVQG